MSAETLPMVRPWADDEPPEYTLERDELIELAVERAVTRWLDGNVDRLADMIAKRVTAHVVTAEGKVRKRAAPAADGRSHTRSRPARDEEIVSKVVEIVEANPGIIQSDLRKHLTGAASARLERIIGGIVESGKLHRHPGARSGSYAYHVGPECEGGCKSEYVDVIERGGDDWRVQWWEQADSTPPAVRELTGAGASAASDVYRVLASIPGEPVGRVEVGRGVNAAPGRKCGDLTVWRALRLLQGLGLVASPRREFYVLDGGSE